MVALEEKTFQVSWEQFHQDSKTLAWRLSDKDTWHTIVAITRGGLVPAGIVSRELNIRKIETICISSYEHKHQTETLSIVKEISPKIIKNTQGGEGILIIDELSDTGKTAKMVKEVLPKAHFATVYTKPSGRQFCDTFVTQVSQNTWIYFPWDLGLSFQKPITPGGE